MASRARKRLWHAAWLAAVVLSAGACSSDDVVQIETVELADGEFYGLAWGGTQVERFHVLARPGPRDGAVEDELVLVSPQHAKPCSLGSVQRYYTQQPRSGSKYVLGSPSPARVALFDGIDEHGFGTLSFADIECERTDLSLPDIAVGDPLRLYPPDLEQMLLGVRDRDRSVLLVDPWKDRVTNVAQNVDQVWLAENGAWLREGGALVKRDLKGREQRRLGHAVTEFLILGGDTDLAYVDEGKLIVEHAGKAMTVAKDACRVRMLDSFIPGALSYYSPCEARRLVITPAIGKSIGYEANVAGYLAQRGQLFVVYDAEDDSSTALWRARAQDPEKLQLWAEFPHIQVQDVYPAGARWIVVGRHDDDLVSMWRLGDATPSPEPSVIVDRVVSLLNTSRATAWLQDAGELTLRDRDASGTLLTARNVTRFSFVFPGSSTALVYLSDVNVESGLGRLQLRFLTGESFVLARDVQEYREVWWPERGILYIRGGARPGIRFARVEIPCEMTSDSPWACGF